MANPTLGVYGAVLDLKVRQGGTFGPYRAQLKQPVVPATDPVTYEPVDLTGYALRGQIRKNPKQPKLIDITLTLIDAVNGIFELSMTDEQTAALPAGDKPTDPASTYVWDLEMELSGAVRPLFYGTVNVLREVTKAS